MSFLGGIHDLGYVFTRAGAATGAGLQGDWLTMGANIGAGLGKLMWYGRNHIKSIAKNIKDPELLKGKGPTATWIVDVAIVGVAIIDLMNGLLVPVSGTEFTTGKGQFALTAEKLEAADPDERDWSGDAATGYTNQNAALKDLIAKIQDIDTRMAETVKGQADQVNQAHKICALTSLGLVITQGIALALYAFLPWGPALSFKVQIIAVAAATIAVLTGEGVLIGHSQTNATTMTGLGGEYDTVKAGAEAIKGGFQKITVKGAQQTSAVTSEFSAISEGLSGYSAPPTVIKLAQESGDPQSRELVDSLTEDTVTGASTPKTETPAPAAPAAATPAFSPPTLAQISAASAQATKISGNASQHMNLFNQTMGSVQSLAQMGQQGGQGGAKPAEAAADEAVDAAKGGAAPADATLASDTESAGAAAGVGGGERPPVEFKTAGTNVHDDRPGERLP